MDNIPLQIRQEILRGEMDPVLLERYSFKNSRRGKLKGDPRSPSEISESKKIRQEERKKRQVRRVYRAHVGHRDPDLFPSCPECKLAIANRTEKAIFYKKVWEITEVSFRTYYSTLNPLGLTRGSEWHLDHKFSIAEAFRSGVPAEVVGSYHNLEMLSKEDNLKKGDTCSILEEDLRLLVNQNIEFLAPHK